MSLGNETFYPLSTWPVLCNGGGLFRWQVGHISVAYFFFPCHRYLFLILYYGIAVSWLSYSVSAWSLGQQVWRFSPAIAHLSSFWGFGNLQNHPVSLKIYASLLIANGKSVLNINSRRRPTSLHLKRRPYKVVLRGIRAKHSASSLKVFICNFCLPSNASLSWLGSSFFPACPPFVNTVYTPDQSRGSPRKVRNFYMYIFKIRFVLNVSKVHLSMFSEKTDIVRGWKKVKTFLVIHTNTWFILSSSAHKTIEQFFRFLLI